MLACPIVRWDTTVSILFLLQEEFRLLTLCLISLSFLLSKFTEIHLSCHPLLIASTICLFMSVRGNALPSIGFLSLIATSLAAVPAFRVCMCCFNQYYYLTYK